MLDKFCNSNRDLRMHVIPALSAGIMSKIRIVMLSVVAKVIRKLQRDDVVQNYSKNFKSFTNRRNSLAYLNP